MSGLFQGLQYFNRIPISSNKIKVGNRGDICFYHSVRFWLFFMSIEIYFMIYYDVIHICIIVHQNGSTEAFLLSFVPIVFIIYLSIYGVIWKQDISRVISADPFIFILIMSKTFNTNSPSNLRKLLYQLFPASKC